MPCCLGFIVPSSIHIIIFKDMIWIWKKLGGQHRFRATQKKRVEHGHGNMATCSTVDHGEFPKLPALTPGWRQSGGTWSSRGEGLTCWTMESLLVDWCDQTNDVVNALKLGLAVTSSCLAKFGKIVALLKWSAASKPVRLEQYCGNWCEPGMAWYGKIWPDCPEIEKTPSEVTSNNNHALHHKASIATCRFLEYKELLDLIKAPLLTTSVLRLQFSILLPNSLRFAANKTKKKEHHSGKHYEEHLWGSQRQYICACTF